MGLFSTIARAFKDATARVDADIAAKKAAEFEREALEWVQEGQRLDRLPWDPQTFYCQDCYKASGELPIDYRFGAHPSEILSIAHMSRDNRMKEFQKILRRAESLQRSRHARLCDIHAEMEFRVTAFFLQEDSSESSRARIDTYCIDCGKEQGEVDIEENKFSLPLSPRGQQAIGERAPVLCEKHAEEERQRRRDILFPDLQA